jgi:hypothetical protein
MAGATELALMLLGFWFPYLGQYAPFSVHPATGWNLKQSHFRAVADIAIIEVYCSIYAAARLSAAGKC